MFQLLLTNQWIDGPMDGLKTSGLLDKAAAKNAVKSPRIKPNTNGRKIQRDESPKAKKNLASPTTAISAD